MQNGDLASSHREELIVILEGVLCKVTITPGEKRKLLRQRSHPATIHISWHEVPLKRMVTINNRFPHYEVEIITFIPDVLDEAAEFLNEARIPYNSIRYQDMGRFTSTLRYKPYIRAIYDSDPQRLDQYGQLGHAVVRGEDF